VADGRQEYLVEGAATTEVRKIFTSVTSSFVKVSITSSTTRHARPEPVGYLRTSERIMAEAA
jgi:hypothetical protein